MLRKSLYRTLLRIGKDFDKNPRYKALVFTSDARFPTGGDDDFPMNYVMDYATERTLKRYVDSFCGGSFYAPEVSLADTIRQAFRQPLPEVLTATEQNELAFMASRLLFNCRWFATQISSGPVVSSSDSSSIRSISEPSEVSETSSVNRGSEPIKTPLRLSGTTGPLLSRSSRVEPGTLVISHPLNIEDHRRGAVILITHVEEGRVVGVALNNTYQRSFAGVLGKFHTSRYGAYMKPFYDCACFDGGQVIMPGLRKYMLLHQQESLAHLSRKLPLLPGAPGVDLSRRYRDDLESSAQRSERSADRAVQRAVPADTTFPPAKDYVYVSWDLKRVSAEIQRGLASSDDIKIVSGFCVWEGQELEKELKENKVFLAQVAPSVQLSSSTSIEGTAVQAVPGEGEDRRADRLLMADMVMCPPPLDEDEGVPSLQGVGADSWLDRRAWTSGSYAWCKAMLYLGGEFEDMARLHALSDGRWERRDLHFDTLRRLCDYGRREYPEGEGDPSDDFDEEEGVMQLRMSRNGKGTIWVSELDSDEEGFGYSSSEDVFGEDFSDDDDDDGYRKG